MNQMFNDILQAGIEETLRKGHRFFLEELKHIIEECAEAQLDGKATCEKLLNYINSTLTHDSVRRY